jgi:hypothetical protein
MMTARNQVWDQVGGRVMRQVRAQAREPPDGRQVVQFS